MNKKYIIKKNEEIQKIIKEGKKLISKFFIIYYKDNIYSYNRFCISVSKKLGNAVVRNKSKRRIKDVLLKNVINNENDYVIIVRNEFLKLSYEQIKEKLLKMLKGEKNEIK